MHAVSYKFIHCEMNSLGTTKKMFYNQYGYVIFPKLVGDDLLEKFRLRFIDICNGKVEKGGLTIFKQPLLSDPNAEGEYLINKIQGFAYDDILSEYCFYKPILDVVSDIVGPNISAVQTMLINKPPDANPEASKHPLHQDLHYFPFRPPELIVASWTAMEDVNEENGCLFVVPGSHKGNLLRHDHETMKGTMYFEVNEMDDLPKVNLPMEKGDTVFFHPLLLHGSLPNKSKGFRKAISCHFASSNCHFVNVRGTSQDNVLKGVEAVLKGKGIPLPFEDAWKYRSRLVQGQPGEFQKLNSNL